jgi:hypothetical protein
MEGIAVVGLDLAKNVFQVHGVNAAGGVVVRRQVRRGQMLTFFSSCRHVSWALKPAHQRIIGLAN